MYLRSQCDRQLYLSLFSNNPEELKRAGLPLPLKSRPGVQLITQSGRDFEIEQYDELQRAIPGHVIANPQFTDVNLQVALSRKDLPSPVFIFQPAFEPEEYREHALANFGLDAEEQALIPKLSGLRPDALYIYEPKGESFEILPTGKRKLIELGDKRLGISVIDLKNVTEANSSYSAEVCLYAYFLANWLSQDTTGLNKRYFVSDKIYLWKHVEMPNFKKTLELKQGSDSHLRIQALLTDLSEGLVEPVIFMPSVAKFFKDDVPRVVRQGDQNGWDSIPYHVNEKCGACDYLGVKSWLSKDEERIFQASSTHYCFPNAEQTDHHSMLPGISKGASTILSQEGHPQLSNLVGIAQSAPVLTKHTLLKKERSQIGSRALAIHADQLSIDENVKLAAITSNSNLNVEFDVIINFDSGSGLLTGIAVRGIMFAPYGQTFTNVDGASASFRSFGEEAFVVERGLPISEWAALKGFIAKLSQWAGLANQTFTNNSWGSCKAQICFWEKRQYEELCNAFGRHLDQILQLQDRDSKAMAWLFPSEELMERDEQIAPGVVFIKDVVESVVRLPVKFSQTLLNVADAYHHHRMIPRKVDPYYREPLGNSIPRERIFEIWKSTTGTVQMYGQPEPLSKAVRKYEDILRANAWALSSITAKLRTDFSGRIEGKAPAISLSIPAGTIGVASDSKLWIKWDEVDASTAETERKNELITRTDHLESSYKAIVLPTMLEDLGNNRYKFSVSEESTEAKIDEGDSYLVLGFQNISGYPLLTGMKLGIQPSPGIDYSVLNTPLHKLIRATLIEFDRLNRTAIVEIGPSWAPYTTLFNKMVRLGHVPIGNQSIYLIEGLPYNDAKTTKEILREVGNPPSATPTLQALRAMGITGRRPVAGNSAETPLSQVLWNAGNLANQSIRTNAEVQAAVEFAVELDDTLDDSQRSAIAGCLSKKLSIIWGPPGTGKTKTLGALIRAAVFEAQDSGRSKKILITGPNYRAVDELAERVQILLNDHTACEADLIWAYSKSRLPKTVSDHGRHIEVHAVQIDDPAGESQIIIESINNPNRVTIIATTAHNIRSLSKFIAGAGSSALQSIFDMVIIDESSQVPVTLALKALSSIKAEGQIVIAGDHLQMPPISSLDAPLNSEFMVGSIQTYLLKKFSIPTQDLLVNYRSNQDLVDFAKSLGYPQALRANERELSLSVINRIEDVVHDLPDDLPRSPAIASILDPNKKVLTFIHDDVVSSQANIFEAKMVAALAYSLRYSMSSKLHPVSDGAAIELYTDEDFFKIGIGVVTPHKAQKALVIRELKKLFENVNPEYIVEAVDTVERFQGGERHTIIVSYGVGDVDIIQGEEAFLLQMERTNVAVSRAKAKCIVIMPKALAYHLPTDAKATKTALAIKSYIEEFCHQRSNVMIEIEGQIRYGEVRWH